MLKKAPLATILIILTVMQLCCISEIRAASTIDIQNKIKTKDQEISRWEKEAKQSSLFPWRLKTIKEKIKVLQTQKVIYIEQLEQLNRFSVTLECLELSEVHGYYACSSNSNPKCNLVVYFYHPSGDPITKFHFSGATKKDFSDYPKNQIRVYQGHNRLKLQAGLITEQLMCDIDLPYKRGEEGNRIPNRLFQDTESSFVVRYPFDRAWKVVGDCEKTASLFFPYPNPGFKYRVYLRITKR